MRTVALIAMVVGSAVSGHSSDIPRPMATFDVSSLLSTNQAKPESTMKTIAFVSDSLIAVGLCNFQHSHPNPHVSIPVKDNCTLALLHLENGVLRPLAQTHQFSPCRSIHLTSEGRILTMPFGRAPAVLYSTDLSTAVELLPLQYSSRSGNTVAQLVPGGWKLFHLDSALHPIRSGFGTLKSISDEVVVFQDRDTLRTETLDGASLGAFKLKPSWYVQAIGSDRLLLSEYKRGRVADYDGTERSSFRPLEGASSWAADARRVLFDHFSRNISAGQNVREILVMLGTVGLGVVNQAPNREDVEVVEIATGNSCFILRRAFAANSEASSQNATISPSGEFVAMLVGGTLSVYDLPIACEAKQ